jgi:hypothetical protein
LGVLVFLLRLSLSSFFAAKEIDILQMFTREARVRMKQNFRRIDINDDEPLKALAEDAFEVERFRWDTI